VDSANLVTLFCDQVSSSPPTPPQAQAASLDAQGVALARAEADLQVTANKLVPRLSQCRQTKGNDFFPLVFSSHVIPM